MASKVVQLSFLEADAKSYDDMSSEIINNLISRERDRERDLEKFLKIQDECKSEKDHKLFNMVGGLFSRDKKRDKDIKELLEWTHEFEQKCMDFQNQINNMIAYESRERETILTGP